MMAATCMWVAAKLEECTSVKPGHVVLVTERLLQRSEGGAVRVLEHGGTVSASPLPTCFMRMLRFVCCACCLRGLVAAAKQGRRRALNYIVFAMRV